MRKLRTTKHRHRFLLGVYGLTTLGFVGAGFFLIWATQLEIPDSQSFHERKVAESTKIYDRTGTVLLYDIHQTVKRTVVPFEEISRLVKNSTIAIEDAEFYQHKGIKPSAILRAVLANIRSGSYSQGGSTITQQVVKNALLTQEKTFTRKLKEAVLALKLEAAIPKDDILTLYFNETPYGGSIYGIEEASRSFFGKSAKDVTLGEAAYLAAIPKAPSYYSPYGSHVTELKARKNLVLRRMYELGFITEEERAVAEKEEVRFIPAGDDSLKAPHFVMYVKSYLEEKYGTDVVETGGLRVITTLDYEKQKIAEDMAKRYAEQNEKKFNAGNTAMVGIDPKTGQILMMVGSRDYFDVEHDGNFNIALAKRQPGSSFKPFVYAAAFKKGYTPDTVLFDVKTQFDTSCSPSGEPLYATANCYTPVNYDGLYRGPMTLRDALAQSINTVAIKTLYLVGIPDAIRTAQAFGIESLDDPNRYGLTLVLGGGEVSLLELTGAYSVFANEGVRNNPAMILEVKDSSDNILESFEQKSEQAIDPEVARQISSVLSDNKARAPAFGENSLLYIPGRDVAAKTGTTNDYKDAWIIGYTPNFALGAWAGNNDNTPMEKKVAGFIIAPLWNEYFQTILPTLPNEEFTPPPSTPRDIKPILRGVWQGGESFTIDTVSGKLATEYTPEETRKEIALTNVHSILHWIHKRNPAGAAPTSPSDDSQYSLWEYAVQAWVAEHTKQLTTTTSAPTETDNIHIPANFPAGQIATVIADDNTIQATVKRTDLAQKYPTKKVEWYANGRFVGESLSQPYTIRIHPEDLEVASVTVEIQARIVDSVYNRGIVTKTVSL